MIPAGFIYNDLWMIESLGGDDRKTGRQLYQDVWEPSCDASPVLSRQFHSVSDSGGFNNILRNVLVSAKGGKYPLLHIECHGSKDGLVLSNGDVLTWKELTPLIKNINVACGVNLCVIFAACYGFEAMWLAGYGGFDRAPFYSIVAPNKKIGDLTLEKAFAAFYRVLLNSNDIGTALKECNNQITGKKLHIKIIDAEHLLEFAYSKSGYEGKEKRDHIENMLTELMQVPKIKSKGVSWARKQIKRRLKDEEGGFFEGIRARYFCMDTHPENRARFGINKR